MTEATTHHLRWIDEARMLDVVGVARSTFLGWARAGLIEQHPGGAYEEATTLEVALLAALRDHFSLQDLATRWPRLRADGAVAQFIRRARSLEAGSRYDLVVELKHGGVTVATDDAELAAAVREPGVARPIVVIDAAARVRLVCQAFDRWAVVAPKPTTRKVGRPPKRGADVRQLRAS